MSEERSERIARVVTKSRMGEEPSDFAYWQSRPLEERIQALLDIRQHYHEWRYGTEPGFERVLAVTALARR